MSLQFQRSAAEGSGYSEAHICLEGGDSLACLIKWSQVPESEMCSEI